MKCILKPLQYKIQNFRKYLTILNDVYTNKINYSNCHIQCFHCSHWLTLYSLSLVVHTCLPILFSLFVLSQFIVNYACLDALSKGMYLLCLLHRVETNECTIWQHNLVPCFLSSAVKHFAFCRFWTAWNSIIWHNKNLF